MFRFPVLPVTSLQGATLDFEKLQKILNPPWVPLTLITAKVEAYGPAEAPAVRLENNRVFFRGPIVVKAGKEVTAGATFAQLPNSNFYPQKIIFIAGGRTNNVANLIEVNPAGEVITGLKINGTEAFAMDGLNYGVG